MNVNKQDPRITAFALGELDDDERDAIEQAIAVDPELQGSVKEIGVAANLAGLAFRPDDGPQLSDEQRQAILDASEHLVKPVFRRRRRVWRMARVAAVAACVVLGLGAYSYWTMVEESDSARSAGSMHASEIRELDSLRLRQLDAHISEDERSADAFGSGEDYFFTEAEGSEFVAMPPESKEQKEETVARLLRKRHSNLQNVQVGGEIRIREVVTPGTEKPGEPTDVPEVLQDAGVYQAYFGPDVSSMPESPPAKTPPPVLTERDEVQRQDLASNAGVSQATSNLYSADTKGSDSLATAPAETNQPSAAAWSDPAKATESAIRSYDVDGDGVLEGVPFYTKPDGSKPPARQLGVNEVNVVIADNDATPTGPSGGGGFGGQSGFDGFGRQNGIAGGGGFGGGGQSSNQFSTTIENGAIADRIQVIQNHTDPNSSSFNVDLDSYDIWGEDFRSDYVSGRGRRAGSDDDVRIYQAYIETDEKLLAKLSRRVPGTESYAPIPQKPFTQVSQEPLSTFSVDVDTASYSNVRRFLTQGQLPPPDAVRVEEMINYFDYEYASPRGQDPISVDVEIAQCVWETQHRLARIALKAREVPMDDRGPANLVFLIDVSGSMKDANKLPLLKESMKALTRQLESKDRVAIVTYRDAASLALSPTTVGDKITVETAINALHAKGSTNGAGGLELAYSVASQNVISGSINRVILATDGDFNVGETDNDRLVELIRNSAATGVFLTVLGFGEGNLKDDRLEAMADKGDGAYHYIDNYNEATRVLCAQVGATLATVAKDVKVQVEFNPQHVSAYRLIGYENRALAAADFNNDRKDAGEMGSGEAVTALYELVPLGVSTTPGRGVDELKYQSNPEPERPISGEADPETMTVKVRYKDPEGDASRKFEVPVVDRGRGYDQISRDYRWAVAVAGFGSLLRHPPMHHVAWVNDDGVLVTQANVENPERLGTLTLAKVREIAEGANGYDPDGRRAEFLSLVVAAQTLTGQ